MLGLSAIGNGGVSSLWRQTYYYMGVSAARTAAANPARAETPVEAVPAVKRLASDLPVKFPLFVPEFRLPDAGRIGDASETLARMRIRYPAEDELMPLPGQKREASGPAAVGEEAAEDENGQTSPAELAEEEECQTCANRRYQDGSDDPGVSFKLPTNLTPEEAASAVRMHEHQHVVRERAAAEREGRKVISQSVTIHTNVCPECGTLYVSGGETRTVTAPDRAEDPQPEPAAA